MTHTTALGVALLAVLVLAVDAPAQPGNRSALTEWQSAAWQSNKEAVVKLRVYGRKNATTSQEFTGTGFFFHRDGFLLTAGHVIGRRGDWFEDLNTQEIDRKIQLWNEAVDNTQKSQLNPEQVVVLYIDPQLDLALLRVRGMYPDGKYPTIRLGNAALAGPPDEVLAIGWSNRPSPVPVPGTIQIAFDPRAGGQFRLRIDLQPGDSGGPVLAKDGRVIGIISQGDRLATDKPAFAQPVNFAANLLNLTLRAAALEEALTTLDEMQGPIRQFEPVRLGFEKVTNSITALETLAEQLKKTARPVAVLQRQTIFDDVLVYLTVRFRREFSSQYLPDRMSVVSFPAWEINLKDLAEEERKTVPPTMTARESAAAELVYATKIEQGLEEKAVGWNLLEWLRITLEDKYRLKRGALKKPLRIQSADVEIKWWFKGDSNEYTVFLPSVSFPQ